MLRFTKGKKIDSSIVFHPTTFEEVYKIIHCFKNKSSTGLDNISPKLFKFFPVKILSCFVHIFNLSMSEDKFVTRFKHAKVVPVLKSKDKYDMDNFRPISLLPVASKILEKIIHTRLYSKPLAITISQWFRHEWFRSVKFCAKSTYYYTTNIDYDYYSKLHNLLGCASCLQGSEQWW